jgi:hypothetical protein
VSVRPFVNFDGEARLGNRLGLNLYDGLSDADTRRTRIREAINRRGAHEPYSEREGQAVSFAEAFEALYGEPL